jgi:hypothetical protein
METIVAARASRTSAGTRLSRRSDLGRSHVGPRWPGRAGARVSGGQGSGPGWGPAASVSEAAGGPGARRPSDSPGAAPHPVVGVHDPRAAASSSAGPTKESIPCSREGSDPTTSSANPSTLSGLGRHSAVGGDQPSSASSISVDSGSPELPRNSRRKSMRAGVVMVQSSVVWSTPPHCWHCTPQLSVRDGRNLRAPVVFWSRVGGLLGVGSISRSQPGGSGRRSRFRLNVMTFSSSWHCQPMEQELTYLSGPAEGSSPVNGPTPTPRSDRSPGASVSVRDHPGPDAVAFPIGVAHGGRCGRLSRKPYGCR